MVLPVTPPAVALTWDVPWAVPLASPAVVMLATAWFDEAQVAELVRFCTDPSEYVPVAANDCVVPLAIDGFAGVTATETRTAGPTLTAVLPVTPAELALICDVPWPVPVTRPPALTVATVVSEELQVTELPRVCVLPSE